MLEFVAFGSMVTGILYAKHRKGERKSEQHYIEKVFRNTGVGIADRDKEGQATAVRFPTLKNTGVKDGYVWYLYRLPVGMTYSRVMDSHPLDTILENMFNKDVVVEDKKNNMILVKIYKERLPKSIPYNLEWLNECKKYCVVIGVDHDGLVFHDFNLTPHLIIGGMTRYGKSVVMKLLIAQLVLKCRLGLKFHLFDLKGGLAFNRFKRLPQVRSVSRDEAESLKNLKNIRNQIRKRQIYFEEKGYEDIGEAWNAGERIDREIIVVDEASVLAPQSKSDQIRSDCRTILEYIAQVAGGLGYNLIMCSQYPTGDILPRQVKQNSDARLSFRLPTTTASGVILDEPGAEEIGFGMKGRAIYKTDGKKMIQVPYMDNKTIDLLMEPFKQEVVEYDDTSTEESGEGLPNTSDFKPFGNGHPLTVAENS